jgi:uncharacterized protein YjiS (DUF1127 family)
MRDDGLALGECVRHPTPEQWAVLRKHIISRAHAERRQVIRQTAEGVGRIGRQGWAAARHLFELLQNAWRAHLTRRQRIRELAELCKMSDIELKDIGISRSEIHGAMLSKAKCLSRGK